MESDTKANVLLVDDRPENLLAMETVLADLGQNLIRAGSAGEALRFLLVEDVALILLDVQMPGVNGFELAELIRERERTQHTPIIFVTAISDNDQFVFKGYSLGAVDYLTKPVDPEILRSKVRFFIKLFRQNEEIKRQAELLEESNTRLDVLNTGLEHRVAERTAELKAANLELEKEIAVRTQSEARLSTQHAIIRHLADSKGIEDATPPILKAFCEHMNAQICCLWTLNPAGTELTCSHIELCADSRRFDYFVTESRRSGFPMGVGIPGQVWKKKAPVWLPNPLLGDEFPRARFAATAGLQGSVGFPIKIQGEFYGVIEFFTPYPLPEDLHLLNMLEAIGSEIGQFIQRKGAEADRERLLLREKSLREQAEEASRLKDEFLATVSHELRTPLNSILGWGQLIQHGKLTADEQKNALETIFRNAKSQAQLIDDLLDTSRLITGNLRLELSPTNVIATIETAVETVRPASDAKEISISTEFTSDIESITCDPQRLQQMVWNLLTNAVKFTPHGGKINVEFRHTAEAVQIVVSDTGRGISAEFLPFVFDRFRQADSSSTRSSEGVGLGLAIVRHLAELHGGSAFVTSEGIGKGSTFSITLPLSAMTKLPLEKIPNESNGSPPNGEISSAALKGIRVLLIDDDADAREMMSFALELLGAEVNASSSVSHALSSMASLRPDVLLTDINMPGEDGYSFINKLRSLQPDEGANIPAIALTAMARPEDRDRAIAAGFQLHVSKPVDIDELSGAISRLLGQNSLTAENSDSETAVHGS